MVISKEDVTRLCVQENGRAFSDLQRAGRPQQ